MADSRHTTRRTSLKAKRAVQSLLATAVKAAAVQQKSVRIWTKLIAETMQEMHGGEWVFDIDHETGFVLIHPSVGNEREMA